MQWPPRPGPGLNDANPNGFVAAASTTSQTSMLHPVAQLRELVDERDVDGAVDVLEQLRQLGGLGCRDLVHRVDRGAVDVGRRLRRGRVDAADDLRRRLRRPVLAARVDALGRHREVEVLAGLQPRALLEDRLQDLARRARPRRRLEHDDLAALQHRREARARRARCRRGRARAGARAASAARSARRAPASPARSRSSRRRGPSSTSGSRRSELTSSMWLSPRFSASTTCGWTSTSSTRWPASPKVAASGTPT